jgi:hypothetical protein
MSFDAMVAAVSPESGTPSGSVQFQDNGTDLGPAVWLSERRATLAVSWLPPGSHIITAVYQGDDCFNRSTSATLLHTSEKATVTITLTGLAQTYDGFPKAASASTTPAVVSGLSIS